MLQLTARCAGGVGVDALPAVASLPRLSAVATAPTGTWASTVGVELARQAEALEHSRTGQWPALPNATVIQFMAAHELVLGN